jgi:hypothetical protein
MLYRPSPDGHIKFDTGAFETLTVADAQEAEIAALDGWIEADEALTVRPHPLDHDGDGKLGGSLPDAVAPRKRGRPRKGAQ